MDDIRGLSLTPPWPLAILRQGKRIENRTGWRGCRYRGPVLLHASRVRDRREFARQCFKLGLDRDLAAVFQGHVVGVADLVGVVHPSGAVEGQRDNEVTVRELTETERRWWFGGFALVLDNVDAFHTPVPCRGALGLWRVPDESASRVEWEVCRARARRFARDWLASEDSLTGQDG